MKQKPSKERHPGGRPGGHRLPKHGGKKAEAEEGKEAEVEWGLRDLLGMVTRADLEGLPEGPVLRTEHRVLAVLLHKVRVLRGWSLRQLALACGTSHQELAQLEAAKHGAMVETWLRLCGALRVPYSRFVKCAELCAASGW